MAKPAGIIERMRGLLRMNINAALDNAEDPIKALNLIVEDMRSEIHAAKKQVAEAIVQEKLVKRQVEDIEKTLTIWQGRAESALRAKDEALARESLAQKAKAETQLHALAPQLESIKGGNDELKKELQAMQERFVEVSRKKEVLSAKTKIAEARSAASKRSPASYVDQSQLMLDRAEEKVRLIEARAEADREVSKLQASTAMALDELNRKGQEIDIDGELARLKKKIAEEN